MSCLFFSISLAATVYLFFWGVVGDLDLLLCAGSLCGIENRFDSNGILGLFFRSNETVSVLCNFSWVCE